MTSPFSDLYKNFTILVHVQDNKYIWEALGKFNIIKLNIFKATISNKYALYITVLSIIMSSAIYFFKVYFAIRNARKLQFAVVLCPTCSVQVMSLLFLCNLSLDKRPFGVDFI